MSLTSKQDLTGMRFGALVVIKEGEPLLNSKGYRLIRWDCLCDCGNEVTVRPADLKRGHTISCGCLGKLHRKNGTTKHGLRYKRAYNIYCGIMERCYTKTCNAYNLYGGRGIKVCDEWRGPNGAENFYKWAMMNGYNDNLSIDRIDTNGDYCPSNCRWTDAKTQSNNRRTNLYIEIDGETKTLKQWTEQYHANYSAVYQRIARMGWDAKEALTKPVNDRRR